MIYYPAGGYPGFYFWQFPSTATVPEIIEVSASIRRRHQMGSAVVSQAHVRATVAVRLTVEVEVDR